MDPVQDPLRFQDSISEDNPLGDAARGNAPNVSSARSEPISSASSQEGVNRSEFPLQSTGLEDSPPQDLPGSSSSSSVSRSKPTDAVTSSTSLLESALENVDLGPTKPRSLLVEEASSVQRSVGGLESLESGPVQEREMAEDFHRTGPLVHVSVTDPVKRVSDHSFIPGLTSSHYEYLLTSTPLPHATAAMGLEPWPRAEVRRRFNDFVALADVLAESYRGYFLYPRPDKGTLDGIAAGISEAEFVDLRRAELEKYLRKLLSHPEIGRGEELRVFLTAEGSLATSFAWRQIQPIRGSLAEGIARLPSQLVGSSPSVPTTMDVAKNPRYTNDLLRRFKELGEKMRQEYQPPADLSPQEIYLREAKAGVESFADVLVTASRKAEKLIREMERMAGAYGDLGLSLLRVSNYEDKEAENVGAYSPMGSAARSLSADLRRVGMSTVKMSRLTRAATGECVGSLETVHEELAMAPVAVDALNEREAALLTVRSLKDDAEKRRINVEALENGGGAPGDQAKARKVQNLRNEIASLEAAIEAAEMEYVKVKERNEVELDRWRSGRSKRFVSMANRVGSLEATYYERVSELCSALSKDLLDDSSNT